MTQLRDLPAETVDKLPDTPVRYVKGQGYSSRYLAEQQQSQGLPTLYLCYPYPATAEVAVPGMKPNLYFPSRRRTAMKLAFSGILGTALDYCFLVRPPRHACSHVAHCVLANAEQSVGCPESARQQG